MCACPAIRAALDRSKLAPKPAPCLTPKEAVVMYQAAEQGFEMARHFYIEEKRNDADYGRDVFWTKYWGDESMTDARAIMRAVSVVPRCS
jgi:hypothetical protein